MISISGIALALSGFALVSVIGWEIMASPWLIASLTLIALGLVAGKSRRSEWLESQMRRHVPGRLGVDFDIQRKAGFALLGSSCPYDDQARVT